MSSFKHTDLKLVAPAFDHPVTDLIIDLDHLRKKQLGGSTAPWIFFQLKHIFHLLESIGSARIEGNNTTLAEYIETKIERPVKRKASFIEIENMEEAMTFMDEYLKDGDINHSFIRRLHQLVVKELPPPPDGEGDKTPGEFRKLPVTIQGSEHVPPQLNQQVETYMDELIEFINRKDPPRYDLLKIALAHHRFMWIHPFTNGNGRTGRLLTYALLVKQGFTINRGRIVNPTAVFCINRKDYYDHLAEADSATDEGLLKWCEYVLRGLKNEIEKIDSLLNIDFLRNEILIPSLRYALTDKLITELEFKILLKSVLVKGQSIKQSDIKEYFKDKLPQEISRSIKKLRDKKMLMPVKDAQRKYHIRFDNNYLLRAIMRSLDEKGFLPLKD